MVTPTDRPDDITICKAALEQWGIVGQVVMVFEEMAELQKELTKYLRGQRHFSRIAEEIADVEIMLLQMMILFDCADQVAEKRDQKLTRLWGRLKGEERCAF
ncbi:MAG: hypothetical protein AB1609_00680 [Bacillota bacterium]